MLPRFSRLLALRVALACCSLAAHALGGSEPRLRVHLEYTADPELGCPSAAELSASIARQLGYEPFVEERYEQRLRIAITKEGERPQAELEWFEGQQQSEGERRLTADDGGCDELGRNLVFVVAVQIQLHASAAAPPPAEPEPAKPRPAPDTPRPPAPTPNPTRRSVAVGLGGLLRHGSSPRVAPGLRVFGALSREPWSLELSAHATLPTGQAQSDGSGFSARELGLSLAPCVRSAPFGFCAVGNLSVLQVRGRGVDRIGSQSSPAGGVGGRLQLFWPALERVGVTIQGEALALLAPREVFLNQTRVWTTSPVAFTAILDFAAIFR